MLVVHIYLHDTPLVHVHRLQLLSLLLLLLLLLVFTMFFFLRSFSMPIRTQTDIQAHTYEDTVGVVRAYAIQHEEFPNEELSVSLLFMLFLLVFPAFIRLNHKKSNDLPRLHLVGFCSSIKQYAIAYNYSCCLCFLLSSRCFALF